MPSSPIAYPLGQHLVITSIAGLLLPVLGESQPPPWTASLWTGGSRDTLLTIDGRHTSPADAPEEARPLKATASVFR
jgi:hypothetical protein